MELPPSIPCWRNITTPADYKAALVDLGAYALARGEWGLVAAPTRIIAARRWRHV
jgi:hypothetical protein